MSHCGDSVCDTRSASLKKGQIETSSRTEDVYVRHRSYRFESLVRVSFVSIVSTLTDTCFQVWVCLFTHPRGSTSYILLCASFD
jgi:hypothetical protein